MNFLKIGINIATLLGIMVLSSLWLSSSKPEVLNPTSDQGVVLQNFFEETRQSIEYGNNPFQTEVWPNIDSPDQISGLEFPQNGDFWQWDVQNETLETKVESLLLSLSDEELVSQVFLFGWDSEFPEGVILDWIRQRNIGGLKIFGWNGRNIERMANTIGVLQTLALSTYAGIPLFTATDQEGGWVRHVKDTTSITPGNMALGASTLPGDSYLSGYYIGQELRAMGINMNFAPTVDIYRNPEAHVIGPRAFSSEVDLTSTLGLAFYLGMEHSRVIATAKHFPGHGNATGDSHGEMPIVPDTWEDLIERDLVPFQVLIDAGLPAVLTGHLSFPNITGDSKPASLSSIFKSEILRESLKFEGLSITDDLYMEGAWEYGAESGWSIAEITLEALRAGNDLVMLSRTPALNDKVWNLVINEYKNDPGFRNGIQNSVRRILTIKYRYLFPDDRVPLIPDSSLVYSFVPYPGAQEFFSEQAARSVHVLSGNNLPIRNFGQERILLIGQDPDFFRTGRQFFPGAREFQFPYTPMYFASPTILESAPRIAQDYDIIIFNLANPNSAQVLDSLSFLPNAGERIFVLSILTPAYLDSLSWIQNGVAVFGWGTDSFNAGFSVLTGQIPGTGTNPIPHVLRNR